MSFDRSAAILPLLSKANIPLDRQAEVLMDAFARRVAYSLPLPSAPTPPEAYFNTLAEFVCDQACRVNETCVINVDEAVARTKALWMVRYQVVFDPMSAPAQLAMSSALNAGGDQQYDAGLATELGSAIGVLEFSPPGAEPSATLAPAA